MTTLAKDLKVEDASRLATKARLVAVHVSGIKANIITSGSIADGDLGWKFVPMKLVWGIEDGQLRVVVPVSLHILRGGNSNAAEAVAQIGVLLRLDYDMVDADESEAAIESYLGISGCMHAWPYIRAEVQQLTTKLELPPLLLPPIVSGNVGSVVHSVTRASEGEATTKKRAAKKRRGSSAKSLGR